MDTTGNKSRVLWSFSLYGGWFLGLLFHGPIIYEQLGDFLDSSLMFPIGLSIVHILGLLSSGWLIKDLKKAKSALIFITVLSFGGSAVFFSSYSILWEGTMIVLGFFSGLYIGGWAFYLKAFYKKEERFRAVGKVLIYSNFLLMVLSVVARIMGPYVALMGTMILLLLSIVFNLKVEHTYSIERDVSKENTKNLQRKSLKPLVPLFLFILAITINSGIMYAVVIPGFGDLSTIASYYFVLPYITAIYFVQRLPRGKPRAYTLYIGLAFLGFSYILFIFMERSVVPYLGINGLMMGALGIFDLFWWSKLANFFEDYKNPAKIFGAGLGINVIGIALGGAIGEALYSSGQAVAVSLAALGLILIAVTILPMLSEQSIHYEEFKQKILDREGESLSKESIDDDFTTLTPREREIAELLIQGYTYKAMAEELHLSSNTIKYHVKNIYGKYEVSNKMDFIRKAGT